ncbi:MAG: hypothetical protein ACI4KE_07630 [Anaerovoracaceae bacterium]
MKGMFEEYGGFVVTAIVALMIVSFLVFSFVMPDGAFHRLVAGSLAENGAVTQTVIDEWDIGSVKATLKDDGGLYITGTGTLPDYESIDDTPWKDQSENIDFVKVSGSVTAGDKIPIK